MTYGTRELADDELVRHGDIVVTIVVEHQGMATCKTCERQGPDAGRDPLYGYDGPECPDCEGTGEVRAVERTARDASRFEGLTVGTSKHIRSRGVFLARQVTVIEVVFLRITIEERDI